MNQTTRKVEALFDWQQADAPSQFPQVQSSQVAPSEAMPAEDRETFLPGSASASPAPVPAAGAGSEVFSLLNALREAETLPKITAPLTPVMPSAPAMATTAPSSTSPALGAAQPAPQPAMLPLSMYQPTVAAAPTPGIQQLPPEGWLIAALNTESPAAQPAAVAATPAVPSSPITLAEPVIKRMSMAPAPVPASQQAAPQQPAPQQAATSQPAAANPAALTPDMPPIEAPVVAAETSKPASSVQQSPAVLVWRGLRRTSGQVAKTTKTLATVTQAEVEKASTSLKHMQERAASQLRSAMAARKEAMQAEAKAKAEARAAQEAALAKIAQEKLLLEKHASERQDQERQPQAAHPQGMQPTMQPSTLQANGAPSVPPLASVPPSMVLVPQPNPVFKPASAALEPKAPEMRVPEARTAEPRVTVNEVPRAAAKEIHAPVAMAAPVVKVAPAPVPVVSSAADAVIGGKVVGAKPEGGSGKAAVVAPSAVNEALMSAYIPEWLEDRLSLHHRWVESNGSEGKRFRYNGEDFSGASLAGQDLSYANFRGANLAGMDLRQANVTGADFSEADLSRAKLADVIATKAVFTRANLSFADMQGIEAHGANANFANFEGARLKDAQWIGAQLRETNFKGAVTLDIQMQGANLRGANFFETMLDGADLREADMRGARLERSILTGAKLMGASLKDAQLVNIDYAQTDFTCALDVPQEIQLLALAAERQKLNASRALLETRFQSMQQREQKMLASLRVLEQKRHHDGQFEQQEMALLQSLAKHSNWMRNSCFWWGGIVTVTASVGFFALQGVAVAAINLPALGAMACVAVLIVALAALSCVRIWRIRRALSQLTAHRQALKAAMSAQAAEILATASASEGRA